MSLKMRAVLGTFCDITFPKFYSPRIIRRCGAGLQEAVVVVADEGVVGRRKVWDANNRPLPRLLLCRCTRHLQRRAPNPAALLRLETGVPTHRWLSSTIRTATIPRLRNDAGSTIPVWSRSDSGSL